MSVYFTDALFLVNNIIFHLYTPMMSHHISNNLKGALGEIFVKREFKEEGIEIEERYTPKIGERYEIKDGLICMYTHNNGIILYDGKEYFEKFGTPVLPDFLVKDAKIFIEVKTGKSAKLEKNQLEEFPKILKKGYRIFIIRPKLNIEKRKFEVEDYYCAEFLGRQKRKKYSIEEVKRIIKENIRTQSRKRKD